MKRYFVIIGAMRTGSNLLEKTLAALGDTICYGEVFNPAFIGGPRKTEVFGWDKTRRDADPFACLEALITSEPKLIPGFRIFNGHNPAVLEHVLSDPWCARILLRRDPLESFVSLKIARATDQWMLKRPERRLQARIKFDQIEFAEYTARLDRHYALCAEIMDETGQDALHVDYSDLSDRTVMNSLVAHIGSIGVPPHEPPLIRQNPGHLSAKVENYEEMCAALDIDPSLPKQRLVTTSDLITPHNLPATFAPIPGPAVLPTVALLQRIEARSFGQSQASRTDLINAIDSPGLFGRDFPDGAAVHGRTTITAVCHPVLRALGLFAQTLFSTSWRGSSLRHSITRSFPELLDMTEVDVQQGGKDAILRQAFSTFLAALTDRPHAPDHASRHASQAQVLKAYQDLGVDPKVIKLENFMAEAGDLTIALDVEPVPPGQVVSIHSFADGPVLDALAFPEAAHLKVVEEMWADDYQAFDYQTVLPVAC